MSSKAPTSPRSAAIPTLLVCGILCTALLLHTAYITHLIHTSLPPAHMNENSESRTEPQQATHVPDLFVYRRTKKTGSSSMLDALLKILEPYGYTSLYHYNPERMDAIVRTQMNSAGGRLFIAQHNRVTRLHAPGKRVVIADTFLDGYKQITSFCRYVRKVETCDGRMVQCMKGRFALAQNEYRWAGREGESWDVYIDMPLSSEYPALSTSVVRNTFPGAHLDIKQYNVANSSCPELKGLRDVYTRYYAKLEKQISRLRYRMLYLTGYSSVAAPGENVNVVEMLEAAEILEQEKYGVGSGKGEADASYSERHRQLIENVPKWQKIDGKVILGKVKAT